MKPLFLFLASSLNTEIVYVILKSITQFSYICCDDHNFKLTRSKRNKLKMIDEQNGDCTLILNKIKIKDYQQWSQTSQLDLCQNSRVKRRSTLRTRDRESEVQENILTIDSKVKVTFHQINVFKRTFKEYLSSFELLHASLSPKFNRDSIFKSGKGAGSSGSFFFYSHDRQFIIKTISKSERDLLLKILPNLSKHFMENPNSLLARIFGVFTIETSRVDKVYVLLMENTLQVHQVDQLRNIFDLKGSTIDRLVTGKTKSTDTLKDINFLKIKKKNPKLMSMD